LNRELEARGQ
jgi:hypothetical protein